MFKFNSQLYKSFAKTHRNSIIKETIDKYGKRMVWKNDGTDTLLDVGCGLGDTVPQFLVPLMPSNYKQIVGYDISEDMVKFANESYATERVKFKVIDIVSDLSKKIDKMEKFDHATSFYTLMWVSDTRKAISNISKFLKQNGDIIMVVASRFALFDFIQEQIVLDKLSKQLSQYKPVWAKTYDRCTYEKEFKSYLTEAGFKQIDIETKPIAANFESREDFKQFFNALNPVYTLLSKDQQEEMFDEFVEFNLNVNSRKPHKDVIDASLCMQLDVLTGYASKQGN